MSRARGQGVYYHTGRSGHIESGAVTYYVYILASRPNGTLYVGVTNNLPLRAYQHREGHAEGFTKRYGVHKLVYFETFSDIRAAIQREKRVKRWRRKWKLALIEENNPTWRDLYPEIASH